MAKCFLLTVFLFVGLTAQGQFFNRLVFEKSLIDDAQVLFMDPGTDLFCADIISVRAQLCKNNDSPSNTFSMNAPVLSTLPSTIDISFDGNQDPVEFTGIKLGPVSTLYDRGQIISTRPNIDPGTTIGTIINPNTGDINVDIGGSDFGGSIPSTSIPSVNPGNGIDVIDIKFPDRTGPGIGISFPTDPIVCCTTYVNSNEQYIQMKPKLDGAYVNYRGAYLNLKFIENYLPGEDEKTLIKIYNARREVVYETEASKKFGPNRLSLFVTTGGGSSTLDPDTFYVVQVEGINKGQSLYARIKTRTAR